MQSTVYLLFENSTGYALFEQVEVDEIAMQLGAVSRAAAAAAAGRNRNRNRTKRNRGVHVTLAPSSLTSLTSLTRA